jgi:dUTP pyrophosphatase
MRVKKLDSRATIPVRGTPGSAGADLFSIEEQKIAPGEIVKIRTGLAFEIPEGKFIKIFDRSSMVTKRSLIALAGVIDEDYRGHLLVVLHNVGDKTISIAPYEKIAQMVILKYEVEEFEEAAELSDTSRGEGGFGSTGV